MKMKKSGFLQMVNVRPFELLMFSSELSSVLARIFFKMYYNTLHRNLFSVLIFGAFPLRLTVYSLFVF